MPVEEVFVVAGDHVHPARRAQIPQRFDVHAPRREAAVDQVSRYHDQTSPEGVGPVDHGASPGTRKQAADVEIGQLKHCVAVEFRRKPYNAYLDIVHRRHPYRLMHADRGEEGGRDTDGIARAVGDSHSSALDSHGDQRRAVEHQLQQREDDDRPERPIEENDDRTREFRREHRT
jgi:hypothetical protein